MSGRDTIFFVILRFIFSAAFTIWISNWLEGSAQTRRIEIVDNVGGAALGVIVSRLADSLAAMLSSIRLHALNQNFGAGESVMVGFVHDQIGDSTLVPVFLKISPHFVRLISPWFPSRLPPIRSAGVEV